MGKRKKLKYKKVVDPNRVAGVNVAPKKRELNDSNKISGSLKRLMAEQERAKLPQKRKRKPKATLAEEPPTASSNSTTNENKSEKSPKQKASAEKNKTNAANTKKDANPEVKFEGMRKGESFQDFSKRLAQETKVEMIKAAKESKEPTQKHKRYLERRKEQKARKKRKTVPSETKEKSFDSLKDKVAFGDVAERPPIFTAAPKPKKKNQKPPLTPEEEQERRAKDLILRETLQRYDALRKKRRQELREQRANATDTTEKVDAPATQYL